MQAKQKLCAGCGEPKYIWKSVKGKKYCKECSMTGKIPESETPEKVLIKDCNQVKLVARKQINSKSEKQKVRDFEYLKLRREFLNKPENSTCYAKLPNICSGGFKQQLTVHHKNGRVGDNLLNTEHWIPLCMFCHMWVETHPKEAREMGLSGTKH
jgi:hypothetical protein